MKYTCPVCGYIGLDEDPIENDRTYEICPSCFVEFGFDCFTEDPQSVINCRIKWIKDGARWHNGLDVTHGGHCDHSPDESWDAIEQMREAGFFSINR